MSAPPIADGGDGALRSTPLHAWHVAHGAKMMLFAGYDMPVWYPTGIKTEHTHTRASAGLFDVSHMGVATIAGTNGYDSIAAALETVVPADVAAIAPGRQRYTQLLNADGGVIDDLMMSRPVEPLDDVASDSLTIVVNADNKDSVLAHIADALASVDASITVTHHDELALIALQGPQAENVLAELLPAVREMKFMDSRIFHLDAEHIDAARVVVSRSGYTGEDGFEIAIHSDGASELWDRLAADARVLPVGLGARDSLRLEAGLCLYGHDLDPTISPLEADLGWSIQKRRKEQIRSLGDAAVAGGARLRRELVEGVLRLRVGLRPVDRAPVREGASLFDSPDPSKSAEPIGEVRSGGFGPSIDGPIAMGFLPPGFAAIGTEVYAELRGKRVPMRVHTLPFVPHSYKR